MARWLSTAATAALATAIAAGAAAQDASVPAMLQTAPTARSAANAAVVVLGGEQARIVGTGGEAGLEVYALDGERLATLPAGRADGVDVRYQIPVGGTSRTVLAALDKGGNALRFYLDGDDGLTEAGARPVPIGFAGESLCLYRNARDQGLYAFALGGEGEIAQFHVFDRDGRLDAALVRELRVPSEASYCVADDRTSDLYVAEQAVGVWRFGADPEADTTPQLIDAARLGRITGEVGGLTLYDGGDGARRLVVSNASADSFHVYDREADHAHLGTFSIERGPGGVRGVKEAGGLHALSWPVDAQFPAGILLATDDDSQSYKTASWADIAAALGLAAGAPQDPQRVPAPDVPVVRPTVETTPVGGEGDAADDPAIWVDPVDPARSLIIATDKRAGLYVYDLEGKVVQFVADGRMNNVDLRDGFRLGGRTVSLVTASNRTGRSISIYVMDPETRRLVDVADGPQATGFKDPYGLCMYRNRRGRTYVFINDTDGTKRQWELLAQPNGKVRTRLVREIKFETQVEGCVADDEASALYVAEEDRGLWRLGAEPNAGSRMTLVASPATHPALKADLEGIGLFDRGGGRGYLVLSSQGNDTYAVFRREGNNAYLGSFAVVADPALGIDGASETDGLDVTSRPLGRAFPHGLFIAQDGRNVAPRERQNFKLVPWERIAQALGLD